MEAFEHGDHLVFAVRTARQPGQFDRPFIGLGPGVTEEGPAVKGKFLSATRPCGFAASE